MFASSSRTRRNRIGVAAIGALLSIGLIAACGGETDDGGDRSSSGGDSGGGDKNATLQSLKDKGTITVGIAGEEPYSFTNDDGELTGATIALHKEIWGNLGVDNVEAKQVEWDALIPGLNAGRYDAISAGMSILPDRCKQADFGNPEIMYTTALMVPEGNPEDLHDMQDVKESGVKFAAMNGAIEQGYADEMGIDAMTVASPEDGMEAVESGRADVYALTGISLRALAEKNPDAEVEVTDPFTAVVNGTEQVGAGATVFRKDADELREAYNKELDKIVGDEQSFDDIVGEFGFTEAERPQGDVNTKMLCAGNLPDAEGSDG